MFSHIPNRSIARSIAVMCATVILAGGHTAQAGINIWTTQGPQGGLIRALAIDPGTPGTLYAATNGTGLFKSTDAGITWRPANAGLPDGGVYDPDLGAFNGVAALAIDPRTPSTLYAGTDSVGVFKSTDAGDTWISADTGLPDGYSVAALAIDPHTPSTLYAGT